jgi:hypothetical protein
MLRKGAIVWLVCGSLMVHSTAGGLFSSVPQGEAALKGQTGQTDSLTGDSRATYTAPR